MKENFILNYRKAKRDEKFWENVFSFGCGFVFVIALIIGMILVKNLT